MSARIPTYRKHKSSGLAVVTIQGKDHYLGRHGTAASKAEYARLIAELAAGVVRHAPRRDEPAGQTVSMVIAAYTRHAREKYGSRTSARSRLSLVKRGLRPVRKLYGPTSAADFGPLALRAVRQVFIGKDFSRAYVRDLTAVVVRAFKWAASMELIPAATYQALTTVGGLERGQAREGKKIKPALLEHVQAVKGKVSKQVAALIDLQVCTGMRPGEVVLMRACDLDMTGKLWTYKPAHHKTEHFGIERSIIIGPKAQRIIKRFLAGRATDAYLFSPSEADADRRARITAERQTPAGYGNTVGSNRKRKPRRKPGRHYTPTTYARAVNRACEDLGIPPWTPNQLRHLAATEIRKEFGAEAARIMLGHTHLRTTEIYAERDIEIARRVAEKVG